MKEDVVAQRYYQELHDVLLTHDGNKLAAFYRKWGHEVPRDDVLQIMPYVMICNENYFTAEEKEEAEKWLRDNDHEDLINKKPLN